jgi:HEAT repeat protein
MPVTMNDVRAWLDAEEVDYSGAAAKLGPEALPYLQELAGSPDVMLASKATYLASLIGGEQAMPILQAAAGREEGAVRVAAASGLKHLNEQQAAAIADRLLGDHDLGVRKMAVKSVASFATPSMRERLKRAAEQDPEPLIRDLAGHHLAR